MPVMRRVASRTMLAASAVAGAMLTAAPAAAQSLGHKYWAEISAYRASIDTEVNVARPGQPGTDIDMEGELGLNNHETLPDIVLGARWERWFVVGEYFALDRNGSRTVTRDIVFNGQTFPASTTLDSEFRSDVYRLSVGYLFVNDPRAQFGVALGLHATDFKVGLEGEVLLPGGGRQLQARRTNFLAPLPTLGVVGNYEVAPKVILSGRADYLSLKIDDYDGSILNAQASLGYRFTDNFEVGVGYRYVDYDLDVDKNNYEAKIRYDFSGPAVFLRAGFR